MDWAEKQVEERGGYLIVVGRFIPGGRTAVTLACGLLEMRWRKFISFDVFAGFVWASYAALLGYVGGRTFEKNPLYGFLIAFAVALAITGAVEMYRWHRNRIAREVRRSSCSGSSARCRQGARRRPFPLDHIVVVVFENKESDG